MPKKRPQSPTVHSVNPGMVLVKSYVVLFVVNALVLYLANMYFPKQVVLGTMSITTVWAILHSMGTLALVNTLAIPFAHELERLKGRKLTSAEWMIKYFLLNIAGIWAITRFPDQFGFGVSAWYVIAILAAVLDFVQGLAMMQMQKMQEKR